MRKSMTEGNTVKLILSFAFPLLLGNLFQQTYNVVDSAIVGQFLGTEALASVGASTSVQFLVLGFCIGTCAGFAVPVAQRFGAKDQKRMENYIFNGSILTGLIALILTVICAVLCSNILDILSTPKNIYQGAYDYLFIIFLGLPFTLLYNYLASILRAVGDSKTPFIFLAFSTVLNIALDLFFILVLRLGCGGAALATILAQGISGISCLIYIIKKVSVLHMKKENRYLKGQVIRNLVVMGTPMGLQFSITAIGSMVMQSANNSLGSVYVSGFTAALRIKQFVMCPFDALATGVSTFCSQNLGAGKMERIKEGAKKGIFMGCCYGILAGAILIIFGRTLTLLFVKSSATAVLDASAKYLAYIGCFFWALGILNVSRMTVQGLGYSGQSMISGLLEMIARTFVSLVFVPMFGFTAICFADQSAWLSACFFIVPLTIYSIRKSERKLNR